jgi:hypothetical protein
MGKIEMSQLNKPLPSSFLFTDFSIKALEGCKLIYLCICRQKQLSEEIVGLMIDGRERRVRVFRPAYLFDKHSVQAVYACSNCIMGVVLNEIDK